MEPSTYQKAIFDHLIKSDQNLVVEAVAGSGKTKTIEMACNLSELRSSRMQYLVFNKRNQVEAAQKLPAYVSCSTLNAYGNSICRQAYSRYQIDADKTRNIWLYEIHDVRTDSDKKKVYKQCRDACRLVSLFKGHGYATVAECESNLLLLADKFDIELPTDETFVSKVLDTYQIGKRRKNVLDFDDQLFLPIVEELPLPTHYDLAFIDECQDLNPVKIQLVSRMKDLTVRESWWLVTPVRRFMASLERTQRL